MKDAASGRKKKQKKHRNYDLWFKCYEIISKSWKFPSTMSVLGRVNANEGKRHRGEENDVKKRSCPEEQWEHKEGGTLGTRPG